jgi:hypothetical protein
LGDKSRTRGLPIDQRPRPWSSFLNAQSASAARGAAPLPSLPQGRHILLAACEDRELAYEHAHAGVLRGGFSACLFETLGLGERPLSYHALLKRCAARLRAAGIAQSPQLEATHPADLDRPFLGGAAIARAASLIVHYQHAAGWVVDAGLLHGLAASDGDGPMALALYPRDADPARLRDPAATIGQAQVIECFAQYSRVAIEGPEPERESIFAAVARSSPQSRLSVGLSGSTAGVQLAEQALASGSSSLRVAPIERADIVLRAVPGGYTLVWPDERPIARYAGDAHASLAAATARLLQIAHWRRLFRLRNPAHSRLSGAAVELELRSGGELIWPREGQPARLSYRQAGGAWHWPIFEVRLTNRGSRAYYCALLALSDDHTVANLLPGGCMRLDPSASTSLRIAGTVSDELWAAGITETASYLKLISCTASFDTFQLEQAAATRGTAGRLPSGMHDLLQPQGNRALIAMPTSEVLLDDWATVDAAIVVDRPAIEAGGQRG